MFKFNNENTRTMSMTHYELWTYLTPFSSVSIVELEQVNVNKLFIAKTLAGGLTLREINGGNFTG